MSQIDERHGEETDEDEAHCSNCGVELDEDAALQDPPPSQCLQCVCDSLREEVTRKERLYRDEQIEHDATRDERDRLLREAVRAEEAEHALANQQALLDEAQNIAHFNGAERDRLKDELTAEKLAHGDTYDRKVSAERELNKTLDLMECQQKEHETEIGRIALGIESLVADEVISAGRAREIHGLSVEAQRALWGEHPEIYSRTEPGSTAHVQPDRWAALTRLVEKHRRVLIARDAEGDHFLGTGDIEGTGPTLDAALDDAIEKERGDG